MEKIDWSQLELNPFEAIGKDAFLITAGNKEKWNTMTAGWGGMGYMWGRPAVFVFIRESRYTLEFMNQNEKFSISFFDPERKDVLRVCGSTSGRDTDKAKAANITPYEVDGTVAFEEANIVLTCEKKSCHLIDTDGMLDKAQVEKWYPNGDRHYMFVGFLDGCYTATPEEE